MSDERWRRMRLLFDRVLELPAAERGVFLDRELAGDAQLRGEIDALLADHAASSAFLSEAPPPAATATIGPYRLLEPLGEGGFGVVHLAEQTRPIQRRVALKLIKAGMDTKQVIARFEAERQALALMDHPGIAQVFEAGETESGRPYFAMEYVPGVAITTFCDTERLSLRERLQLFLQACDAIQHAHQKGVIHRDIKPSNVLVFRRDGAIALKVIDFGIVKATADVGLSEATLTREGIVLGTVGYMSPEQLGAIEAPVDTRSDIYSLGVVLYELLSGVPPFDRERLRRVAWLELMRLLREEDPPSPALYAARQDTVELARRRSTESRALLRELRGELEWITLKAIEREPDRRYASASELAGDIRRYLAHEPVLAGAPSTAYRLRKYARRHRVGVSAAALVLIAVVAGGVSAGIGFRRALRAEQLARHEADTSQQVSNFLVELFHAAGPDTSRGRDVSARDLLDEGTRRIETAPGMQAPVRARLLDAMSDSYLNLGAHDEGIRLSRAALSVSERARPRDELLVAHYLDKLANAFSMAQQQDSIPPLVDRAIAILSASNPGNPSLLGSCLYRKGRLLMLAGDLTPADSLFAEALRLEESQAQPNPSRLARTYGARATIAGWRYELEAAERFALRALELSEQAGEQMRSAALHGQLAWIYQSMDEPEKGLHHAQLGVDSARRLYAADHLALADALSYLSSALGAQRRYPEAIAAQEEAIAIVRAKAAGSEQLAFSLSVLAILYGASEQYVLAIPPAQEALATYRATLGAEHFRCAETMASLARYYEAERWSDEADRSYRESVELYDRLADQTLPAVLAKLDYADFCHDRGRFEQADDLYDRAGSALDSTNADLRQIYGSYLTGRALLRARQGRHAEAEQMMRTGFRLKRGASAEDDEDLGYDYLAWSELRLRAGDSDGAMEKFQLALRCKVTEKDIADYPELSALSSRLDQARESSP